jgi:hypothetical protein
VLERRSRYSPPASFALPLGLTFRPPLEELLLHVEEVLPEFWMLFRKPTELIYAVQQIGAILPAGE